MKIILIDNHTAHNADLAKLLEDHEVTFADYETIDYDALEADLVILSGSSQQPHYSESFDRETSFIRNTDIPIIGICV